MAESKKPVSKCDREIADNRRKNAEYNNEIKILEKTIRDAKAENAKSTNGDVLSSVL